MKKGPKTIATYYAQFQVKEDGSVWVSVRSGESAGASLRHHLLYVQAGKIDPERRDRAMHAAPGEGILRGMFEGFTGLYLPKSPMTGEQARLIAKELPKRLDHDLAPVILRRGHGGARRANHGLSDEDLAQFAGVVDRELKGIARHKRAELREGIAERFGIPASYGGDARDEALRELVRRGRVLLRKTTAA